MSEAKVLCGALALLQAPLTSVVRSPRCCPNILGKIYCERVCGHGESWLHAHIAGFRALLRLLRGAAGGALGGEWVLADWAVVMAVLRARHVLSPCIIGVVCSGMCGTWETARLTGREKSEQKPPPANGSWDRNARLLLPAGLQVS
jgi:hypothetical protein